MPCSRLVQPCVVAAALVSVCAIGCNDAITLQISSDRPIPQALDAVCVGVADVSGHGGQFGHLYRLEGALATLPQTLRVEPGSASDAFAWVRGDRGGVPVMGAGRRVDFSSDVTLDMPTCTKGPAAAPHMVGVPIGPAGARLVASRGAGGTVLVAVTAGAVIVIDVHDGVTIADAPAPPPGAPVAVIAIDVDGDCDDDVVIATDGAPPTILRRDGATFVQGASIGTTAVAAVAAADVDRDGLPDLVLGAGAKLELWRNGAGGTFTLDTSGALSGGGRVIDVRALALGDLDGDGNPDLVVGQKGQALTAWLGQGGPGTFIPSTAAVPAVPLDVERISLVDSDGDFDPDLAVMVRGAPMRLYINRDGRLEDQSFVRLPQVPTGHAIAIGGWDDGCEPDAVIASDAATPALHGQPTGIFTNDSEVPAASDVVMVDIDDDGDLDALLATAQGVVWLAR